MVLTNGEPPLDRETCERLVALYREARQVLAAKTADPERMVAEYHQVLGLDKDINHSRDAAREKEHASLNRYFNVLPYDYNRVTIKKEASDYLNASEIKPFICATPSSTYISTQGPLAATCADMWQMVLETRSPAVIMLTRVQEKGMPKCHPYFPTSVGEEQDYEHIRVGCLQQEQLDGDVLIRRLTLTDTTSGAQHQLEHMHLFSWPDHGVPADTAGIRHLCTRLDELRHLDRPLVVHCSAGIGRTGTFICVDVMLQMLREWRWVLPEYRSLDVSLTLTALVHCLRQQRMGMVQTADQYLFCYAAIHDATADLLAQHEALLAELPQQ